MHPSINGTLGVQVIWLGMEFKQQQHHECWISSAMSDGAAAALYAGAAAAPLCEENSAVGLATRLRQGCCFVRHFLL